METERSGAWAGTGASEVVARQAPQWPDWGDRSGLRQGDDDL
jgi:hypothetical protein